MAEERIPELGNMAIVTSKTGNKRERKKTQGGREGQANKNKSGQNTQELWGNYRRFDTCVMGIPEGKERKKEQKYLKK